MTEYELPDYAKLVICIFCAGCAIVTTAAIYQYGISALYIPGGAAIIVSLMIWSMIKEIGIP